jgi:acyl-CoA synthetase (NDP forming)
VNKGKKVVMSVKAYPKASEIPDPVDLAIIVVPYRHVLEVVEDCGEKGVKGVVIISAGFRETGEAGAERERQLLELIHQYDMRLVGPNCMGVINTDPDVRLNGTFSRVPPRPGNVAMLTQSGALGDALLQQAASMNLSHSQYASVGNRADIGANELLEYWRQDDRTDVVLLYLESFGDPRSFVSIARQLSRTKPIVAVKSGSTDVGARAAFSHTGALAGIDAGVDALFERCGVVRVDSVEALFDVAQAFASQPLPKGDRVGVLTNAGGPGILATDALSNLGLDIVKLAPESQAQLAEVAHPEASLNNPVDRRGQEGPPRQALAVRVHEPGA